MSQTTAFTRVIAPVAAGAALFAVLLTPGQVRGQTTGSPPSAQPSHGGAHGAAHPGHGVPQDSSFSALQRRGKTAMGVDQHTSVHRFDDLPDGGRIELQRDVDDSAGVRAIREHLKGIAAAFASGDFATPAFVHMRQVPGTATMAAKRGVIRYEFHELPRGGEVRITTSDPEALRAVHEFLAFQRSDHRAGGHDIGDHAGKDRQTVRRGEGQDRAKTGQRPKP